MPISKLNICHTVINEHGPIFHELIELMIESLREGGVQVSLSINDAIPDQLNVLVGATIFLSPETFMKLRTLARGYIVFQSEALDSREGFSPKVTTYIEFLRGAKQVWDYSPQNARYLAQCGLTNVHYIPIGYSPRLERVVDDPVHDIDVLFYGAISPRRRKILEELHLQGFKISVLFGKYAVIRDAYIARAKIQLNIHQFETSHIEQVRLSYLLNNRRFVLSEASDDNPYGDGVAFCNYKDIVARCRYYLKPNMGAERMRIADLGYKCLKNFPTAPSILNALAQLAPN